MKRKAALDGEDNELEAASDVFNESAKDEARHAAMLKGLLDRYFG
jgi:rubrerythrin